MSIKDNFPSVGPSLSLNFARSKTLDPRITFSRTNQTATYMNENGLIVDAGADEPRFDHKYENGVVKSLGLLVEEQRVNNIHVSAPSPSDISQSSTAEGWRDRSNINLEYSSVTSPDGTNNAVGVAYTSSSSDYQIPFIYGDQGTLTSNTSYTLSYWVDDSELVESNNFHLSTIIGTNSWDSSTGRWFVVNYNKTSDTFGSPAYSTRASVTAENANTIFTDISGTVSHYPNNWKRISISFKLDSSYDGYYDSEDTTPDLRFNYGIYMGVAGYTNDNVGNNMKTWGWQLEEGEFPTSYIPTSAGISTRSRDSVIMDGSNFSDWYNENEGTFYCSTTDPKGTVIFGIANTFDNTVYVTAPTSFPFVFRSGGSASSSAGIVTHTGTTKIAVGIETNNNIGCIDGTLTSSNNSATPIGPIRLVVGASPWSATAIGNQINGYVSQLTYYPKRLTNTQLQNLTK